MAQRAGLGRWHVHEARHTAASLMLAMGTKLEIVSRVLGHSSVTVGRAKRRNVGDRQAFAAQATPHSTHARGTPLAPNPWAEATWLP